MIKTREGFWVVAALAIAAGACSKSKAGGPDPAGGRGGAPMGMPVEVVVARTDTVRDEISATGQIEAVQSIELRPEVDGRSSMDCTASIWPVALISSRTVSVRATTTSTGMPIGAPPRPPPAGSGPPALPFLQAPAAIASAMSHTAS